MSPHELEGGGRQRGTGQLEETVASRCIRPAMLGNCEHAGHSIPDSDPEVAPGLEGLDELAVDYLRRELA
jgi:hypothetical protein